MRKPGQGDTLVKIASLGGGAAGIGGVLSKDAEREKKIREEMEKAKAEDSAYQAKIAGIKAKQDHEKEMRKKAAKKKKQSLFKKMMENEGFKKKFDEEKLRLKILLTRQK